MWGRLIMTRCWLRNYHHFKLVNRFNTSTPTTRLAFPKNFCSIAFTTQRPTTSTVYALSSGQGKCGVAVVRVTGSRARDVFNRMTKPSCTPSPRVATLRKIIHPTTGEALDRGLVLWFPGPYSFTGEDSCELQIHGGVAVISAVLSALSTLPGYSPAQPGDFTRRAFHYGKLDLTAVEGLGDLIHAETEAQRKQALRQMEGALGELYKGWRTTLLHCRAALEAYIDFSEDDNIESGVVAEVETKVRELAHSIERHLADGRRGERLRSGLQLTIIGEPNVGKSSFLNTLVQRPAAIVSPIPGTTRDIVETVVDLGGYPVLVSDTAGLRSTSDTIEQEGVKRALAKTQQADLAVIVLEATEILKAIKCEGLKSGSVKCDGLKSRNFKWEVYLKKHLVKLGVLVTEEKSNGINCERTNKIKTDGIRTDEKTDGIRIEEKLTDCRQTDGRLTEEKTDRLRTEEKTDRSETDAIETDRLTNPPQWFNTNSYLTLINKTDLVTDKTDIDLLTRYIENSTILISLKTHCGFETLLEKLQKKCADLCDVSENPTLTAARHRTHISACLEALKNILYADEGFLSEEKCIEGFLGEEKCIEGFLSKEKGMEKNIESSVSLLRSDETTLEAAHHLERAAGHLGHVTGHITNEDVLNQIFSAFCIGK